MEGMAKNMRQVLLQVKNFFISIFYDDDKKTIFLYLFTFFYKVLNLNSRHFSLYHKFPEIDLAVFQMTFR